jgi:hypothetical protein
MNSDRTQAAAREQLYRHLLRTLRMLPAESALSLVHPELPQARLHRGVILPCEDADPEVDAEFFDIAYWLTGVASEGAGECFDLIVRAWIGFGWPTRADRESPPRAAYTRTPDQFGLSVRESVDGYVSLSGATPPFARDTPAGDPFPQTIEYQLSSPEGAGPDSISPATVTDPAAQPDHRDPG